ncbi:TPA: head completion/stabilization protein [Haemophilus influenzae]|uniref:head completion/stabilization protein n=1 Tax=Haemophilus influenzae TaxID=727 RepID=UPI000766D361|nr:head completion/stabilization protein [Haemophilus influenzae]MCK8792376.1 head completion/stabilization protein [Haemophilus influenzae]MCK8856270.1 head completion/stabilization protein [Haemophilus influenzae]MCK8917689.1 head completion/stabilization protein [Haemophilus influenzae]PRI33704.1 Phage head completion protein (GPL) [Haemophilus influenzae]PRI51601.1 Phage head completion protein (GPL) [Haemophilus influenzae]
MFNGRTQDYDDTVITNNGFWSDIYVEEFQKQRAIPLQIPVEMVKAALVAAMQGVDLDLADVAESYRKSAVNSVTEISSPLINGENYAETLYKKAVFARAKAELLPEFNTISGREIHQNRDYVTEQKSLLAEATHAIRTLKGKKRGSVWLL